VRHSQLTYSFESGSSPDKDADPGDGRVVFDGDDRQSVRQLCLLQPDFADLSLMKVMALFGWLSGEAPNASQTLQAHFSGGYVHFAQSQAMDQNDL